MDSNSKRIPWGCIGSVIAAIITGIVALIVADKIPVPSFTGATPVVPEVHPSLPATCAVPNIELLDETAAKLAISALGLQIVKSTKYSAEFPAGTVLSQDPPAGQKLNPCIGEILIVVSLGPIPTTAPPTSIPPSPTPPPFVMTVPAKAGWISTGLRVKAGQTLIVIATGIVNHRHGLSENNATADGNSFVCSKSSCALPNARFGALIGQIGIGRPFVIGTAFEQVTASTGELSLIVNDEDEWYSDNSGDFTVSIWIR